MFYVRLGERQENTTGRTPSKPLANPYKIYGNLIEDSKIVLYSLQSWNVVHVKREANMVARTPMDHKNSVPDFCKENLNERVP
jgi:hypothetical protein